MKYTILVCTIILGCNNNSEPPISEWIGTWQLMELQSDGELESNKTGIRFVFQSDGTYTVRSLSSESGVYLVFDKTFVLKTESRANNFRYDGTWKRSNNMLILLVTSQTWDDPDTPIQKESRSETMMLKLVN